MEEFIKQEVERFEKKFDGWILQDSEEFYRGFDIIYEDIRLALTRAYQAGIDASIEAVGTHKEEEELGYCDTGSDMDYACRSECVSLAIKRLSILKQ